MTTIFDTIVFGLGAMGSAAAYQLAKRGNHVLGIDQFSPPHAFGSSTGDTRITRQAIGEGEQCTLLALRSYDIWKDIEKQTGENLLDECGGLIISSKTEIGHAHVKNFFENTIESAEKYNIAHEVLDATVIRQRFPQFNVHDNEKGYYEPSAGFLRPEACIRTQLALAEKNGAVIRRNEKVKSYSEKNGIVTVITDQGEYQAKNLVLTAGPWIPTLVPQQYASLFKICREVLYWFDSKIPIEAFETPKFPIFIWELQNNPQDLYGFPAINGQNGGIKVATEQYKTSTTADTVNREVSQEEINEMYSTFIAPNLPNLSNNCVKTVCCMYTVTPDFQFIIDRHPDYPSVILASPCSGYGFKHSAAIGEALSQLVIDGKSKIDLSSFSLKRFDQ